MGDRTFDERLFDALKEMENPLKTATADIPTKSGGKYSYDYATLQDVSDIVKSVLAKHGLFYRQACGMATEIADEVATISYCLCTYVFDATEERRLDVRPLVFGSDAQRNGAFETYSRRYALLTAFGMCPIDTDAIETRGAMSTSADLATRIRRGLEALRGLGMEPDTMLPGFEGWETDSRVAQRYLDAIKETYKTANVVQGQFPGTEIGA